EDAKTDAAMGDDSRSMLERIQRVVVGKGILQIEVIGSNGEMDPVQVPWTPRPGKPKREVLEAASGLKGDGRPMKSEVRSAVIRAMALGRLWLQEIVSGKAKDIGEIAD